MGRWKSGFSTANLSMFEGFVGETLRELGYELATGEKSRVRGLYLNRVRALYERYFDAKLFFKAKTPLGQFMVTRDLSWI
jgi:hypothetical protein